MNLCIPQLITNELLSKKNALTRHFWLQDRGKVAFLPQESADRYSAREDLYPEA